MSETTAAGEARASGNDRRQERLQLGAVVALWMAAAALLVGGLDFFLCPDSYFHVAVATKLWQHGLVLREFPWATESVWASGYFDKDWLFHVLLAACVAVAGPLGGAKLLIILLNGAVAAAWWWLFRTLDIGRRWLWLAALPFCTFGIFWERLWHCRPHLLSLALLGVALALLCQRRAGWLALVAALYALSYTGHWQLLGLAGLYDAARWLLSADGRWRWRRGWFLPLTVPVLAGLLAGELLHPNFPANLRGLWLQNVLVIKEYWHGSGSALWAMRPAEMRPLSVGWFVGGLAPVLLGLALVLAAAVRRRTRLERDVCLFAAYTALYLLMALKSQRFIEYFVPAAVTFVALYWTRARAELALPGWTVRGLAAVLALAALAGNSLYVYFCVGPEMVRVGVDRAHSAEAARFLRERLPAGAVVFTQSWSDAPALFFGAPDLRYLVFLDPFFMYARDRERFAAWDRIRAGASPDPLGEIARTFRAQAVFIRGDREPNDSPVVCPFEAQLRQLLGEPALRSATGDVVFLLPATSPEPPAAAGGR